ncbi:MAG TPA: hypothetical protein VMV84_00090 [Dehalococcoidales bacterium]|nr:hypothetical protein [Dehalococcoidales bacterium]
MASKQQVFGILYKASAALGREELGEKVGQPVREWQTQLKGWMDKGFIKDTGDQHYVLTDTGREESLKEGELKGIEDIENLVIDDSKQTVPGGNGEEGASKIAVATTEKQQFLRLGKLSGVVPLSLIVQTADYVWEGGDYKNMVWVAQAMQELGLDKDVRSRWWHCWRAKMRQPIPGDLSPEFLLSESKTDDKKEGKKEEGAGKRDYMLSEDDQPTRVGEGLGDLDYKDALDLAKLRTARRKDASPPSTSSQIDDVIKIVNLVKSTEGEKAVGKSYIVKPGEDGSSVVEEVESGKPILVQSSPAAKQGPSYYVDSESGTVKELTPGQPLVIVKEAPKPATTGGTHYLIDNKSGEVKEVAPGQPVIIIRESGQAQSTPIQVKDKDGNPMVLDLSTFIRLEEHRDKQRREEESHETKMEIAKSFKDMLNLTGKALSNTIGGEGEEK